MMTSLDNKRRIITAIINLVASTSFDKLSVVDICNEAGISKQTFYRTFPDKYRAVLWYINGSLKMSCRRIGRDLTWRQGFLRYFEFVERNRIIMKKFHGSLNFNSINLSIIDQAMSDFSKAYEKLHSAPMTALIAYQNFMFSRICTLAVNEWLTVDCAPVASEFIDEFLTLVPRELFVALDIPEKTNVDPATIIVTV